MQDFNFQRASSVSEAVRVLKSSDGAKLLAGGQSLIPIMKLGLAQPPTVVSIGSIQELKGIARNGNEVTIGAGATHADVAASEVVRGAIGALADLAGDIGDAQVRNRGTLGGSIAHADPAADYPAALVALGATVVTDRRQVTADDFFTGMFSTALEEDEIITQVRFPIPQAAAYAKFSNPASKYAIVGVFVAKTAGGVRVGITGASPAVFRSAPLERALSANFSADAVAPVPIPKDDLVTDLHADAEYRAHLVTVMAKRAVAACR